MWTSIPRSLSIIVASRPIWPDPITNARSRVPDLQPLLGEKRLFDRLGANARRLGEDAEMLEVLRHLHDVFGVVDEVLGQIPMAEVDSALVVNLVAGDVVPADQVEDRLTRPADRAGDKIARSDFSDLVSHLDDLPEALVPDHQVLAAGWGVAVESLVDLAIGRVDADLQAPSPERARPSGILHTWGCGWSDSLGTGISRRCTLFGLPGSTATAFIGMSSPDRREKVTRRNGRA